MVLSVAEALIACGEIIHECNSDADCKGLGKCVQTPCSAQCKTDAARNEDCKVCKAKHLLSDEDNESWYNGFDSEPHICCSSSREQGTLLGENANCTGCFHLLAVLVGRFTQTFPAKKHSF